MNGVNHSLKSLLYAYNILLASSSNIPLSLYGRTDSLGFLLTFPKYKCKPWYYSGGKKCIMHGGEEAWLKHSSHEKEAWADFKLNVSQQCFVTAKNTNISLATKNRSVMSRTRELQLYWAGHHTPGMVGSVPRTPYSGVIQNKRNSMTGSSRNGKGPRKKSPWD